MTTTQMFEIYDVHESELRQRLDALNKKARKLGVAEVTLTDGVSLLCKFVDADGNMFTWFASAFEPESGRVYEGKATVKGHNEYNGVLETQITRAKLSEVEIA